MFTDMKDFAFRTTVLDKKNLDRLIVSQRRLIVPAVEKHDGKIVKTIGDSFMIVFRDSSDALLCAIDIQEAAQKYSKNKKILQKIEFRLSLSTGELSETQWVLGSDYFGNTVNLASRLLIQTRANKILCTSATHYSVGDDFTMVYLGDIPFKGMLEKEPIYEVLYKKKDIQDFRNGKLSKDAFRLEIEEKIRNTPKEIEDTIFKISAVTAIVSIQPVPFLDIYSSVPLHMYMIHSIWKSYGFDLHMKDVKEILASIWVGIGWAYILGQWFLGLSKIGLPFIGWYLAVPFSFGFTYGLGKTISTYFYYRSQNTYISEADIGEVFTQTRKAAIETGKEQKKEILKHGKEHKDDFMSQIRIFKKHS